MFLQPSCLAPLVSYWGWFDVPQGICGQGWVAMCSPVLLALPPAHLPQIPPLQHLSTHKSHPSSAPGLP